MTDDEYREWLQMLARKHLQLDDFPLMPPGFLEQHVERMSSIARLTRAVKDRSENEMLISGLAKELRDARVDSITQALEGAGVLSALDELPELTFGQLRRSLIPNEDVRMLSRAGVSDPEAEIEIIIQYARLRLAHPDTHPSKIVYSAQAELARAADYLEHGPEGRPKRGAPEAPGSIEQKKIKIEPQKKRKIFNGIGKVLGGAIAGAGNLLLAAGAIMAPESCDRRWSDGVRGSGCGRHLSRYW
jgi:hypothetical protein